MSDNPTSINSWSNNQMNYLDKKNNLRVKELLKEIQSSVDENVINIEEIKQYIEEHAGESRDNIIAEVTKKINSTNSWIDEKINQYSNFIINSEEFNEDFNKLNSQDITQTSNEIEEKVLERAADTKPLTLETKSEIMDGSLSQPMNVKGVNLQLFKETFGLRDFINTHYDTEEWNEILKKYIQVIKIPVNSSYKSFEFGIALKQNIYNISADYDVIEKINRNYTGKLILTHTSDDAQLGFKMVIYNADVDPSNSSDMINPSITFTAIKNEGFLYLFCSKLKLFNLIGIYLAAEAGSVSANVYKSFDKDEKSLTINHGFHRNIQLKDKEFLKIGEDKKWFEEVIANPVMVETENEDGETESNPKLNKFDLYSKNQTKIAKIDESVIKFKNEFNTLIDTSRDYELTFIGNMINVFDLEKNTIEKHYPVRIKFNTGKDEATVEKLTTEVTNLNGYKEKIGSEIPVDNLLNDRLNTKWGEIGDLILNTDLEYLYNFDDNTVSTESNVYLNSPSTYRLTFKDNLYGFTPIKDLINTATLQINRLYYYKIIKTLTNEFYYKEVSVEESSDIEKYLYEYSGLIEEEQNLLQLKITSNKRINDNTEITTEVKQITKYLDQTPSEILRVDDKFFIYFVKKEIADLYKHGVGDRYENYKFNEEEIKNVLFENGRKIDLSSYPEFTELHEFYKSQGYITEDNRTPDLFLEIQSEDLELTETMVKEIDINTNGVSIQAEASVDDKIQIEIISNKKIKITALAPIIDLILTVKTDNILGESIEKTLKINIKGKELTSIKSIFEEIILINETEKIINIESNAETLEYELTENDDLVAEIEKIDGKQIKIITKKEGNCKLVIKGTAEYCLENNLQIPITVSNATVLKVKNVPDNHQLLLPISSKFVFYVDSNDEYYTVESSRPNEVQTSINRDNERQVDVTILDTEINCDIKIKAQSDTGTEETVVLRVSTRQVTQLDYETDYELKLDEVLNLDINTDAASIECSSDDPDIVTIEKIEDKKVRFTGKKVGKTTGIFRATAENKVETIRKFNVNIIDKPETKLLVTVLEPSLKVGESIDIGVVTNADDFTLDTQSNEFIDIEKTADGIRVTAKQLGSTTISLRATADDCNETIRTLDVSIIESVTTIEIDNENPICLTEQTIEINVDTNATIFNVTIDNDEVASIVKKIKSFTIRGLIKGETNINISATADDAEELIKTIPLIVYSETTSLTVNGLDEDERIVNNVRENRVISVETDADDYELIIPEDLKDKIHFIKEENKFWFIEKCEGELTIKVKHSDKLENSIIIPISIVSSSEAIEDSELKTKIDNYRNLYNDLLKNEGNIEEYNRLLDTILDISDPAYGIKVDEDSNLIYDLSKEYYNKLLDKQVLEPTSLSVTPDAFIISSDQTSHNLQEITITTEDENYEVIIQNPDIVEFDREASTIKGLKEGYAIVNILAKVDGKKRSDYQVYVKVVEDCPAKASIKEYENN